MCKRHFLILDEHIFSSQLYIYKKNSSITITIHYHIHQTCHWSLFYWDIPIFHRNLDAIPTFLIWFHIFRFLGFVIAKDKAGGSTGYYGICRTFVVIWVDSLYTVTTVSVGNLHWRMNSWRSVTSTGSLFFVPTFRYQLSVIMNRTE